MTDSNYTHMTLLVDRSGSMAPLAQDVQGGINQLIRDQQKVEGKMTLTLADFDYDSGVIDIQYWMDMADIHKVKEGYRLVARGGTPLLDAIGHVLVRTGETLAALPEDERPAHVIFQIATDGQENASKEYSWDKVKEMIAHQKETYGWEIVFTADEPHVGQGADLGAKSTSNSGTGASWAGTYAVSSAALTNTRTTGESYGGSMPDKVK